MKIKKNDSVVDTYGRDGIVLDAAEFDDWINVRWYKGSTEWVMVSVSIEAAYRNGTRIL